MVDNLTQGRQAHGFIIAVLFLIIIWYISHFDRKDEFTTESMKVASPMDHSYESKLAHTQHTNNMGNQNNKPNINQVFKKYDNVDVSGGTAEYKANTKTRKYYGNFDTEEKCAEYCNQRANCQAYAYTKADFGNAAWHGSCHGITNHNLEPTFITRPGMSSGVKVRGTTGLLMKSG